MCLLLDLFLLTATAKNEPILFRIQFSIIMRPINIDDINNLPNSYPTEFTDYCKAHHLTPPSTASGNGKALLAMLMYPECYWTRTECDLFVHKFSITTADSIQLFNKHNQWGIKTSSGIDKGKYYIVYPYSLSNKHKLRTNFNYGGTYADKCAEIDRIKSTIQHDYVDVPNELWQIGHKNPFYSDTTDLCANMVLQPPIQAKYRDQYIFIDTLTKIPTPSTMRRLLEQKLLILSNQQICEYAQLFSQMVQTDSQRLTQIL